MHLVPNSSLKPSMATSCALLEFSTKIKKEKMNIWLKWVKEAWVSEGNWPDNVCEKIHLKEWINGHDTVLVSNITLRVKHETSLFIFRRNAYHKASILKLLFTTRIRPENFIDDRHFAWFGYLTWQLIDLLKCLAAVRDSAMCTVDCIINNRADGKFIENLIG